jgi:hypothetical protein
MKWPSLIHSANPHKNADLHFTFAFKLNEQNAFMEFYVKIIIVLYTGIHRAWRKCESCGPPVRCAVTNVCIICRDFFYRRGFLSLGALFVTSGAGTQVVPLYLAQIFESSSQHSLRARALKNNPDLNKFSSEPSLTQKTAVVLTG